MEKREDVSIAVVRESLRVMSRQDPGKPLHFRGKKLLSKGLVTEECVEVEKEVLFSFLYTSPRAPYLAFSGGKRKTRRKKVLERQLTRGKSPHYILGVKARQRNSKNEIRIKENNNWEKKFRGRIRD